MSIKTTGAEFKAWLASEWGADAWWDDYVVSINGEEVADYEEDKIADSDSVTVDSGVIFFDAHGDRSMDASRHFNRWKKSLTTATILVEVDIAALSEVKALINAIPGAKVRK